MADNITQTGGGLNTDSSPQNQPKGSYRFALNTVEETELGDSGFRSNEESNESCHELPQGYIPIGKVYIGDEETAVFLAHESNGDSIIGIARQDCTFDTIVDDATQVDKFNFEVINQIDAVYRLRRGCEKVIYFTSKGNKPRQLNFSKLDDYKTTGGDWDVDQFSLHRTVDTLPDISNIDLSNNGNLLPGSYNVGIALLDDDLNSTEVLVTSDTIIVYNDSVSASYPSISGSTTETNDYFSYSNTNKSIIVTPENLDPSYTYYRLFLIEANTSGGQITRVTYTNDIPLSQKSFELTGDNTLFPSTVEEVQQVKLAIEEAEHIEQIENRLILSNVKGPQVDLCEMQKLASGVVSQLAVKTIPLNDITQIGNPKRGTVHLENSMGYMPGEIYAFGIVYEFPDYQSPVFHLPGKAPGDTISNMSSDNQLQNTTYTGNDCNGAPYWGEDYNGNTLDGQFVRHHRFPLRTEVDEALISSSSTILPTSLYKHSAWIRVQGLLNFSYTTTSDFDGYIYVKVEYLDDLGVNQEFIYAHPLVTPYWEDYEIDIYFELPTVTNNNPTYYQDIGGGTYIDDSYVNLVKADGTTDLSNDALKGGKNGIFGWSVDSEFIDEEIPDKITDYTARIFGITFSSIVYPAGAIGFHIVRMERDEANKTILDSGVTAPMMDDGDSNYIAHAQLNPNIATADLSDDYVAIINPEFKFEGKEYQNYDEFIIEAEYLTDFDETYTEHNTAEDAMTGTSYDETVSKRREKDEDGYTLRTFSRFSETTYTLEANATNVPITESPIYLNALSSVVKTAKEIFNAASDNKIAVVKASFNPQRLWYGLLKRNLTDPYANFTFGAYYLEHADTKDNNSTTIYNGDTYVSSMNYTNTMFYEIRLRKRAAKSGVLKIILGSLVMIAAVLVTVLTVAVGTPAGVMIASYGLSLLSSGISQALIRKAYGEAYDKGLKTTIDDITTTSQLANQNPPDDEVRWFTDTIGNIFFESTVNINWRIEPTFGPAFFQESPGHYNPTIVTEYALNKVSVLDTEKANGRLYQGFANAEVYKINKDYKRRNKEKIYFPLGTQYDCCSECKEEFPHRIHWSEQSFQEELSDNYSNFLANNYIDIEGNTGKITDLFRMQNNLYVHTEEALWMLPQNIQERITGEVVSFIGTGEYFSIPPRKMVDDATGMSAGNDHKWATIKTPYGVFFACDRQKFMYRFDGAKLTPISNNGMFNWFKNNGFIALNDYFETTKGRDYPYDNNPSNPFGTGFIAVYDARKERIIFTKRDYVFSDTLMGGSVAEDYEVHFYQGQLLLFQDYNRLLREGEESGNIFKGFVDGQMRFERYDAITETIVVTLIDPERVVLESEIFNKSWTMSYSLKKNTWTSWHSYLPNLYFSTPDKFFSYINGNRNFWEHNRFGHYQNYYDTRYKHIFEYVSVSNAITSRIWDALKLLVEAKRYDSNLKEFVDERYRVYNKAIFYNSRQNSGEVNLVVKDTQPNESEYLMQQVVDDTPDIILLDRNERDWTLNELRDVRVDYNVPMFTSDTEDLQTEYYIDKIVNTNSIDFDKDWTQLESFRDKYLVIRLIFDNFDDTKLILNYSVENEVVSGR